MASFKRYLKITQDLINTLYSYFFPTKSFGEQYEKYQQLPIARSHSFGELANFSTRNRTSRHLCRNSSPRFAANDSTLQARKGPKRAAEYKIDGSSK